MFVQRISDISIGKFVVSRTDLNQLVQTSSHVN